MPPNQQAHRIGISQDTIPTPHIPNTNKTNGHPIKHIITNFPRPNFLHIDLTTTNAFPAAIIAIELYVCSFSVEFAIIEG